MGSDASDASAVLPDGPSPEQPLPELTELTARLAELRAELVQPPAMRVALPELADLMAALAELGAELGPPAVEPAPPAAGLVPPSALPEIPALAESPARSVEGAGLSDPEGRTPPATPPAETEASAEAAGSAGAERAPKASAKAAGSARVEGAPGAARRPRRKLRRRVAVAAVVAGCAVVSSSTAQPLRAVRVDAPLGLPPVDRLMTAGLASAGWQAESPVDTRAELGALMARERSQQTQSPLGAWRPVTKAAVTAASLDAPPFAAATAQAADAQAVQAAITFALAQVGKPYQWGAQGPDAYDCSGLTRRSYAAAGIALPRTSAEQARAGRPVRLADLMPGDLVFWAYTPTDVRTVHHVALYLGGGLVVQAPQPGGFVELAPMWLDGYAGAVRVAAGGLRATLALTIDPRTGAPVPAPAGISGTTGTAGTPTSPGAAPTGSAPPAAPSSTAAPSDPPPATSTGPTPSPTPPDTTSPSNPPPTSSPPSTPDPTPPPTSASPPADSTTPDPSGSAPSTAPSGSDPSGSAPSSPGATEPSAAPTSSAGTASPTATGP
jgi:cell wall-associated NlpC family hydrolase